MVKINMYNYVIMDEYVKTKTSLKVHILLEKL